MSSIPANITIDFTGDGFVEAADHGSNVYTSGDITITYSGAHWFQDTDDGQASSAGLFAGAFSGVETITIEATSGDEFDFSSFFINAFGGGFVSVEGFRDSVSTGTQTSGTGFGQANGTFTVALDDSIFNNVDRVVITSNSSGFFDILDSFVLNTVPNTPPTATNLTQTVAFTEDAGSVALGDIVITDPDAGDTLTASLTLADVSAGSLSTGTFGTATSTYNAGTGVWAVSGSRTDVNAALAAVAFTPAANWAQNTSISTRIRDAADVGPADGSITLNATALNDAPVVTLPLSISVPEDGASALSGISFSDADAGGSSVTATLSVGSGSLAATSAGGVAVGGTASALTLSGSVADINAFIAGGNVVFTTAANATSSVVLTVGIYDGGNTGGGGPLSASGTVTLAVTAVNDAPTVTAPLLIPFTEDTAGAITGISFADVDAGSGTVTVTLSVPSGTMAAISGGGVTAAGTSTARTLVGSIANINAFIAGGNVTYTPAPNEVGNVTLTVLINDDGNTGSGGARSASSAVTLDVTNINDAPTVANVIPNQNATEDAAFNFQFALNTFADPDVGDVLYYSAQLAGGGPVPAWLTFDPVTRIFSGTPGNSDVGTVSIEVTASDGDGETVADTFDIVVANTNDAPTVANPIASQNATQNTPFNFTFPINVFADVDVGDTLAYSAQRAGGGALPAWLSFDDATRTFSGTPANGDVGTVAIDVIASDGKGGSVTHTFAIVVGNVNDAPTVDNPIANQNATEDAAFNFQFASNTFLDGDGDGLTYAAQLAGGGALPGWLTFDPFTRTFSGTPGNADVGTVSIEVTASDGDGETVADTFDIVVANTNDAPTVANPIADQNATQNIAFNFTFAINVFADVDVGDTVAYSAQLAGGGALPGWLIFDPATRTFSGTPANGDIGTVSIDVIASDGKGGSVTESFDIVVGDVNDAPTVANAIADQNATEDTAFSFQFAANTFADPDAGDTLTYIAQLAGGGALPGWLSFDPVTRTFSGTPLNGNVGTVSIDVIANDGHGGTATDTFDIVVANTNDAPTVANAIPNRSATEGVAFNFEFAANTFADVDVGDTLSYSAQLAGGGALPAWLSFDPATRTFSGTPTAANVGTLSIEVMADDGQGGTVTDAFNLVVAATPVDPQPPAPLPPTPPTPPLPGVPDNDGIPTTVEDQAPGIPGPGGTTVAGDGNGDGIKDSEQASVGSIGFALSSTGASNPGDAPPTFTTLVASSQNGKVGSGNDNSRIIGLEQLDAPQDLPDGLQAPIGLVSFTVELAQGRSSESFSLYLDPALGVNGYWKQDASGTWVNLASEPYGGKMLMEGGRLRLDFQIVDGGQFDADGRADGVITDPGAPGHMPLSIMGLAPDMPQGFWF